MRSLEAIPHSPPGSPCRFNIVLTWAALSFLWGGQANQGDQLLKCHARRVDAVVVSGFIFNIPSPFSVVLSGLSQESPNHRKCARFMTGVFPREMLCALASGVGSLNLSGFRQSNKDVQT